jgi:hypothetical protein
MLRLHLLLEKEYLLVMRPGTSDGELFVKDHTAWTGTGAVCHWEIGRICEVRIPIAAIGPEKERCFFAYLTLTRAEEEIGRWPTHSPMALTYRGPELELENWLV